MKNKPRGKFLLTWNNEKHPEVTEFFSEIDEGLYSYSLREIIKTYMEQKNSPNHSNKSDSGLDKEINVQTVKETQKAEKTENKEDSDYTADWSHNDI